MPADYRIRPMVEEDTAQALGLIRASMGEGLVPITEDFWRWKHYENPFGASPGLVAEADEGMVGLRLFMRWQWRSGDQRFDAVRAVDTATHPAWQGRGIFRRLTESLLRQMSEAGAAFVFNTPNDKSRPGYLKMGWRDVARVPVLIRPLRPLRMARGLMRPAGEAHAGLNGAARPVETLLACPELEAFLDRLWRGEARLHTRRDVDYLRWRYAAIPGFEYGALWEFDGESGAVIIAHGRVRRGLREVTISEVMISPDRRGVRLGAALLKRLGAESGADYMAACVAKRAAERKALWRAGFLPFEVASNHFTVRTLGDSKLDPCDWENWRASIGDLEIF